MKNISEPFAQVERKLANAQADLAEIDSIVDRLETLFQRIHGMFRKVSSRCDNYANQIRYVYQVAGQCKIDAYVEKDKAKVEVNAVKRSIAIQKDTSANSIVEIKLIEAQIDLIRTENLVKKVKMLCDEANIYVCETAIYSIPETPHGLFTLPDWRIAAAANAKLSKIRDELNMAKVERDNAKAAFDQAKTICDNIAASSAKTHDDEHLHKMTENKTL